MNPPDNISCMGCWGPLTGVKGGRCPRCGRTFQLENRASYYTGRLTHADVIDIHVIYIVVLVGLVALWMPTGVAIPAMVLIPQGRILIPWNDMGRHKRDEAKRRSAYLYVDQLFLVASGGFVGGLRYLLDL